MSNGAHYRLSESERNELFREQRHALDSSAKAFDEGAGWEAKRLASAVFILCHDPPSTRKNSLSKSLLGQMEIKHKLKYLSTKRKIEDDVIPWIPLIVMHASEGVPFHFAPQQELAQEDWRWLPFSRWWEEEIYRTWDGKKLSRKNLVFAMRSQDGGGHADEFIRDAVYASLRSFTDPRVVRNKPRYGEQSTVAFHSSVDEIEKDKYEPVPGAHLATMRQIAFELITSIGVLLPE